MADPVEDLLPVVRRLEGSGDSAVSPKGAVGRYQIMPDTARGLGIDPTQLTDPDVNEKAARGVLGELTKRYPGDNEAVLAAYNAGPSRADKYINSGRDKSVLPHETQQYLARANLSGAAKPNALPYADDLFSGIAPAQSPQAPQAQSGVPYADELFSDIKPPEISGGDSGTFDYVAKGVQKAFKLTFGDAPLSTWSTSLTPEQQDWFKSRGLFNDYSKGQSSFAKTMLEGLTRNASAAFANTFRYAGAAIGTPFTAAEEAAEKLGFKPHLEEIPQDPSLLMAGIPHVGVETENPLVTKAKAFEENLDNARANAVIGDEGQAGFHGTVDPTPEQQTARDEAVVRMAQREPLRPSSPDVPTTVAPEHVPSKLNLDVVSGKATEEDVARISTEGLAAAESKAWAARYEAYKKAQGEPVGAEIPPPETSVETPTEVRNNADSISKDVTQKLMEAGHDPQLASSYGTLVDSVYNARASRFSAPRAGLDIYNAEGPDIIKGFDAWQDATKGTTTARAEELAQGVKQGAVRFRGVQGIVGLFEKADASTFGHEMMHVWTEDLMRDAQHPDVLPWVKDDAATLRKWAGAPDTGEIPNAAHEKIARGWERYLMEGVAPNQSLGRIFENFKRWLTGIYNTVGKLRAPITDDIRSVYGRLLTGGKAEEAPARSLQPSIHDIHEAEAEHTRPENAAIQADRIRDETDEVATRIAPKEVQNELVEGRLGRGTTPDQGAPGGGAEAGPVTEDHGGAKEPGAVSEGGGEATQESTGAPGAERPKANPNEELPKPELENIDKAGNIRLDNLNTTEDVNRTLKEFAERNNGFIQARRGIVSAQEISDFAQANGLSVSDANIDKLRAMSVEDGIPLAARILGGRQMLVQSARLVHEAMQGDDVLRYAEVSQRHLHIQETLSGITAEWGRAGQAFRSLGDEASKAQELSQFIRDNTGKTLNQIKQQMADGKRLDTPSKVSGFLRDASKPSLGDMLLETFKNWLISGPKTHLTYTIGNKLLTLMRAGPETAVQAAVGKVQETLAGKPIERAYMSEVRASLWGFLYGQGNGLRAAYDSFKAGQTAALPGEDLAKTPFTNTKAVPGMLGSIIRAPGERMVAPIHAYDRAVGYVVARDQLIMRRAMSEGLSGDALTNRMADLTANVPDDITKAARDEATTNALMGPAGEFTRRWSSFVNASINLPVLGHTQPLAFIEPFVNIASTINRLALMERSPLGLLSKQIRTDLSGANGTLAQSSAIAKMSVGTALAGTAAGLRMQGHLKGSAPKDPGEAALSLMEEGLPNSIAIGGVSYQLGRLGVMGTDLSMAADLYDAAHLVEKEGFQSAAGAFMVSASQHFLDEGYASGVADLLKAVEDPSRYGDSYFRNFFATAAVPFSVGATQIAQSIDPYQRESKTLVDAVKAKIPGLSMGLRPRIDLWGNPIPNNEFRGVYARQIQNDPVNQTLLALGVFPGRPPRQISGYTLDEDQYNEYQQEAGQRTYASLHTLIQWGGFKQAPPGIQEKFIRQNIEAARKIADGVMISRYPEIMQAGLAAKIDRVNEGSPKTVQYRATH
jgi:hypothetical protein